jgi:hypothetical protein
MKSMQLRRVAFSAILLGIGMYIWLPTPDEIIIYPVLGFSLSYFFHMSLVYGVLLSMIIYRGTGSACLLTALLIGGKPIYYKLKERLKRKKPSA